MYANLDTIAHYPSNSDAGNLNNVPGEPPRHPYADRFTGGFAAGDTYTGIEGLIGSDYGDVLIGNGLGTTVLGMAGADDLHAGFGAVGDILEGGAGADRHFGGAGADFASYGDAPTGVYVDLDAGNAGVPKEFGSSFAVGDTYVGIDGVYGSNHDDILIASDAGSTIFGFQGADRLVAGDGPDVFGFRAPPVGVTVDQDFQAGKLDTIVGFEPLEDRVRIDRFGKDLAIYVVDSGGSALIYTGASGPSSGILVQGVPQSAFADLALIIT